MHPIERLREVARSGDGDPRLMVHETAAALRGLHLDPGGVVLACRRIVERHPTCGPLWWLAAHLSVAVDPHEATNRLVEYLVDDGVADRLVADLPDGATVCVIGWPDLTADALVRRGDVRSLVIDADGEGEYLVRRLTRRDLDSVCVVPEALAAAVETADLVLVEPLAVGADALLVRRGSFAAAAVARAVGRPTWVVLPRGRYLPATLWAGMVGRWQSLGDVWERRVESMPWHLVDAVLHHDGTSTPPDVGRTPECPDVSDLLRSSPL